MILDLTQLPAEVTFKNVNEITKMRLLSFIDNYIEKDDTITITVYSSEELAVLNRRLKDLNIEVEENDNLPDKIEADTNIIVSFKDYINPNVFSEYVSVIKRLMYLEKYIADYKAEHEEKGDIDDPEIQAEMQRLMDEGNTLTERLRTSFSHYLESENLSVGIMPTNMELLVPILYRNSKNENENEYIMYLYPSIFDDYLTTLIKAFNSDVKIHKEEVTKSGWYKMDMDDSVSNIDFTACDTPKNIKLDNVRISNSTTDLEYIDKTVYKNIFESIIVE